MRLNASGRGKVLMQQIASETCVISESHWYCSHRYISNYSNLGDIQGSRSCLAPRQRLPALLKTHAFDETRRHTIHRVKVIQPRVSKQRQASDTEQCVEHVHHVARPVRDPPTVRVLRGETFISAAEYKKTQTKEEKRK